MTTFGGFGLLVCIFFVPQIVILRRSRLAPGSVWTHGLLSISIGHLAGWTIAPWIFNKMLHWHWAGPRGPVEVMVLMLCSLVVALCATFAVYLAKSKEEKLEQARRARIESTKADLVANGPIRGPGQPSYVRHRKPSPPTRLRLPHETGRSGPYGIPLP
ncbi:MAG: hypothetical protein E4H02_06545 [Lentisphaerales bacterium]|jgi:hypothetical protein|nr:MAG: hypothetical protein E4H02_06545 [Lentisphaerales bacterium]